MQAGNDNTASPYGLSETALLLIFIVAGIVLRWWDLDVRPLHHDESLHAMFGRYYFLYPARLYHQYDPMMHGPLLYTAFRAIYGVLGVSTWAARFPMALIGSLFLFVPLLFRRYLSKTALVVLTAFVSLSPTLIYWSRFIRHDYYLLLWMVIMLAGVVLAKKEWKVLLVLPALSLQICTKENVLVTLALLAGFLVFEAFYARFSDETLLYRLKEYVRRYWLFVFASLAISVFLYVSFYTAGFRYNQNLSRGPFTTGLQFWFEGHAVERIKGPFLYYFYVLAWYELTFVIAFFTHLFLFYRRTTSEVRLLGFSGWIVALALFYLVDEKSLLESVPGKFFKFKNSLDIFGPLVLIPHALAVTVGHLKEGRRELAFFGYFFLATFFTYSYLGEKVPWLALYPLVTGLIYFGLYFDSFPIKRLKGITTGASFSGILFVVFILFSSYSLYLTNFRYAGAASELLSQVHTTREIETLLFKLNREASRRSEEKFLYSKKGTIWPTSWYMRDAKGYSSTLAPEEKQWEYRYVFIKKAKDTSLEIPPGFSMREVKYRGWWVPKYSEMTPQKFIRYALFHEPWNEPGYAFILFFTRKEG